VGGSYPVRAFGEEFLKYSDRVNHVAMVFRTSG
jgi:hypothetical protein